MFQLVHVSLSFHFLYCLWGFLSADCKVVVTFICGVFPRWMGFDHCLARVLWWAGLVPVFWWVKLDLVSLKGNDASSRVFFGVCEIHMALGSLSANGKVCSLIQKILLKVASLRPSCTLPG